MGLILIGILVGAIIITPAGAHLTQNTRHLGQHAWKEVIRAKVFTKQQANRRFALRRSEPFREIGAPGEPDFENNWKNEGFGWSTAGFYKDSGNVVHLKGALQGGADGTTAFTLPEGYRPPENLTLPFAALGGAVVMIRTDGTVQPTCGGPGCYGSIDGVSFRVEP